MEYTNFTSDGVISLSSILPRSDNRGFIVNNYIKSGDGRPYFYLE